MSIAYQMGRLARGPTTLAKRHPLLTFFLLAGLLLAPRTIHDWKYPPTPAELKAAQEQAQRDSDLRQVDLQKNIEQERQQKYLCRLVPICQRYATVRQECAVAGEYNRCVDIKMGASDALLVESCADDGKIAFPQSKVPNFVECFFNNLSKD